ncbi:curli assembly protein CsgF [Telmatospirillum sp. J64-1]|uniref:curli assembly protein CsgF n=1 Tax=Telmatospirillum sp. J64-1 TaxID=2502183 RepID=UPI00115E2D56|nr:curli assembly protein CsgF [Telmatospirillum sp. J64-1]
MAKVTIKVALYSITALSISTAAFAESMVYRPINPSFGGDPFNSSHLLGIANATDRYRDPNAIDPFSLIDTDPQSQLNSQVQQQVIGSVTGNATNAILQQNSGTYLVGSTRIVITPNDDGVTRSIVLTNIDSGAVTRYDVPLYQGMIP